MHRSSLILGAILVLVLGLVVAVWTGSGPSGDGVVEGEGAQEPDPVLLATAPTLDAPVAAEHGGTAAPQHAEIPVRTAQGEQNHGLRVRVVAAITGEPVERFGLHVVPRGNPERLRMFQVRPAELASRPGGVTRLDVDPAEHAYCIHAPGYGDLLGDFEVDPGGEALVELSPEGRLTGRLLSNEVPQPGVRVKLERVRPSSSEPRRPGSITSESSSEGTFDFEFEGGQGRRSYDLDRFTGRKRRETSDARGSFLFGGLAGGTYRVSLDSRTLAPASWTDLVVVAGETHELGDLQVEPEAELEVVPVAPRLGGLSGLTIAIEAEGGEEEVRRVRRSKEGEPVVFKDLPSGSYRLSVEDVPGIVLDLRDVPVTLTAGERRGLELDLAPWQPVPVEVVVRCGGEPLRGVRVAVGRLESSGWIARSPVPSQRPTVPPDLATPGAYLASIRSGRTDDQGRVIFVLPAAEVFDLRIGHEAAPLAIEQDQRTAAGMPLRVIELEAGRLQVELPDIAPSVGVGRLDLTLFDVRAQEVQTSSFVFQEGRAHGDSPDPIEDTDLGHLPPGTYVVEVRRQVLAREVLEALNAQLAPDDGSTPEERAERAVWAAQFQPGLLVEDLVYRATGEVRSGEVTRCRPEPAAPTPPPASPTR